MAKRNRSTFGVVQGFEQGDHGRFAICTSDDEDIEGSITFSLEKPVWTEDDPPERGSEVYLWDLRKKRAGWRAHRARFRRPGDTISKESSKKAKSTKKGAG